VEAVVQRTLAKAYQSLGLYADAETHWQAALDLHRRLYGPDDRATLRVMLGLAITYGAGGKHAQEEKLYRTLLDRQRRCLGREHPDTFLTLVDLLFTLDLQNKTREAESLMDEAKAIYRQALKAGDVTTLDATLDATAILGLTFLYRDRFADALPIYAELLDAAPKIFPPEDWRVGVYEYRYGACLENLHQFEKAEMHLLKSHAILKAALGDQHEWTRDTMDGLACLYREWKKPGLEAKYRALLSASAPQPAASASQPTTSAPAAGGHPSSRPAR
jgi:non-specific serine/threonine protein kinase/serine/threonine-protein kinase